MYVHTCGDYLLSGMCARTAWRCTRNSIRFVLWIHSRDSCYRHSHRLLNEVGLHCLCRDRLWYSNCMHLDWNRVCLNWLRNWVCPVRSARRILRSDRTRCDLFPKRHHSVCKPQVQSQSNTNIKHWLAVRQLSSGSDHGHGRPSDAKVFNLRTPICMNSDQTPRKYAGTNGVAKGSEQCFAQAVI